MDPTMRYVEIHSQTPWTTSEKSWKAVSAPVLWPKELRAALDAQLPLPSHGDADLEEDPFLVERAKLDQMRTSANKINKFYIPISKLPQLGGRDPRLTRGKRPPSCYIDYSVPRAAKAMHRWESMPCLRSQLPVDSLQKIEAASRRHKARPVSQERPAYGNNLSPGRGQGPGNGLFSGRGDQPGSARREDTDARLSKALKEVESGSARGKKEHPHIPCGCCDHQVVKPWMPRVTSNGSSRAATPGSGRAPGPPRAGAAGGRAATPIFKSSAVNAFEDDRIGSSQGQREKHTVSWQEAPSQGASSDAASENWEEQL